MSCLTRQVKKSMCPSARECVLERAWACPCTRSACACTAHRPWCECPLVHKLVMHSLGHPDLHTYQYERRLRVSAPSLKILQKLAVPFCTASSLVQLLGALSHAIPPGEGWPGCHVTFVCHTIAIKIKISAIDCGSYFECLCAAISASLEQCELGGRASLPT